MPHHDHPLMDHVRDGMKAVTIAREDGEITAFESLQIAGKVFDLLAHAIEVVGDDLDKDEILEVALYAYDEFLQPIDITGRPVMEWAIDKYGRKVLEELILGLIQFITESPKQKG